MASPSDDEQSRERAINLRATLHLLRRPSFWWWRIPKASPRRARRVRSAHHPRASEHAPARGTHDARGGRARARRLGSAARRRAADENLRRGVGRQQRGGDLRRVSQGRPHVGSRGEGWLASRGRGRHFQRSHGGSDLVLVFAARRRGRRSGAARGAAAPATAKRPIRLDKLLTELCNATAHRGRAPAPARRGRLSIIPENTWDAKAWTHLGRGAGDRPGESGDPGADPDDLAALGLGLGAGGDDRTSAYSRSLEYLSQSAGGGLYRSSGAGVGGFADARGAHGRIRTGDDAARDASSAAGSSSRADRSGRIVPRSARISTRVVDPTRGRRGRYLPPRTRRGSSSAINPRNPSRGRGWDLYGRILRAGELPGCASPTRRRVRHRPTHRRQDG